jgi:sRNA-binding carbon storage regulator CsrA
VLCFTRTTAAKSRRRDDSVFVLLLPDGQEVRVWLHETFRNGDVRVGVEAPKAVVVERGEVYRSTRGADPHASAAEAREWEQWAARQLGGPPQ